jgi:hypothetical protein
VTDFVGTVSNIRTPYDVNGIYAAAGADPAEITGSLGVNWSETESGPDWSKDWKAVSRAAAAARSVKGVYRSIYCDLGRTASNRLITRSTPDHPPAQNLLGRIFFALSPSTGP